jgi:hypothetical protein
VRPYQGLISARSAASCGPTVDAAVFLTNDGPQRLRRCGPQRIICNLPADADEDDDMTRAIYTQASVIGLLGSICKLATWRRK